MLRRAILYVHRSIRSNSSLRPRVPSLTKSTYCRYLSTVTIPKYKAWNILQGLGFSKTFRSQPCKEFPPNRKVTTPVAVPSCWPDLHETTKRTHHYRLFSPCSGHTELFPLFIAPICPPSLPYVIVAFLLFTSCPPLKSSKQRNPPTQQIPHLFSTSRDIKSQAQQSPK